MDPISWTETGPPPGWAKCSDSLLAVGGNGLRTLPTPQFWWIENKPTDCIRVRTISGGATKIGCCVGPGPFHFPNNADITAHPELVEPPVGGPSTSSPRTGFPEISKNEKALCVGQTPVPSQRPDGRESMISCSLIADGTPFDKGYALDDVDKERAAVPCVMKGHNENRGVPMKTAFPPGSTGRNTCHYVVATCINDGENPEILAASRPNIHGHPQPTTGPIGTPIPSRAIALRLYPLNRQEPQSNPTTTQTSSLRSDPQSY